MSSGTCRAGHLRHREDARAPRPRGAGSPAVKLASVPGPVRGPRDPAAACALRGGSSCARPRQAPQPTRLPRPGPRARRGLRLAPRPDRRCDRRPVDRRGHRLGPLARHGLRATTRHPPVAPRAARHRCRCPRPALLRLVLQARRPQPVALHGRLHRLRRRHARPRPRRQPARALHLLGADDGLLLHAHRAQPGALGQPPLRHPGPARHDLRRPGDAHRHGDHRRDEQLHDQRDARLAAPGRCPDDDGRPPRARRRPHQVGAGALPLLAARRHGRPDPGERLPARSLDGQGRHLPHPAARADLRGRARVASSPARPRPVDDDPRWLARPAPRRHQAPPRLRHGEPAGLHDRPRGRRHPGRRTGRPGPRPLPRPLQVGALLQRRHHRQRDRHPRPDAAARPRAHRTGPRHGRDPVRRLDGRPAAARRLRRQGVGAHRRHRVRSRPPVDDHRLAGRRRPRHRVGTHGRLLRAVRLGCLRNEGGDRRRPEPHPLRRTPRAAHRAGPAVARDPGVRLLR